MGCKRRRDFENKKRHSEKIRVPRKNPGWLLLAEDRILRGLRDAELHDLLGRDLDDLAGGGVAALTGFAVHEDQLSETRESEAVLGVLVRQLRDVLQHAHCLLLGDRGKLGDRGCDLRLSQCFGHSVCC